MKLFSKFRHRWGLFILAIILTLISYFVNEYIVAINILLSSNAGDILKSTITFTSIISGFSASLIGQLISAKNGKNEFLLWYFKTVDSKTFIINVLLGTISAFVLIGTSILLLSYDMINDLLKMIITFIWTLSIFSFILCQINNYYLYLKLLLFIPESKPEHNKTKNLNDNQKKNYFFLFLIIL